MNESSDQQRHQRKTAFEGRVKQQYATRWRCCPACKLSSHLSRDGEWVADSISILSWKRTCWIKTSVFYGASRQANFTTHFLQF